MAGKDPEQRRASLVGLRARALLRAGVTILVLACTAHAQPRQVLDLRYPVPKNLRRFGHVLPEKPST